MKNLSLRLHSHSAGWRIARRLVPTLALCGALGSWTGCTSRPASYLLSAPPPAVPDRTDEKRISTVPVAVASSAIEVTNPGFIMNSAGPPFGRGIVPDPLFLEQKLEIVSAQPSSHHVWIEGYWIWRHREYVWAAGNWELPPNPDEVWIAPRVVEFGRGYEFFDGYWK
jgi:hypothetical protein